MPVLIVITRLRLSDTRHRRTFLEAATAVIDHDVYWTRTAWRDRASMTAFMTAEPHLGTMGSIDEWCDEAAFVEWEQATPQFPDWQAAFDRLVEHGRSAALSRPSPDHEARSFPPPSAR